MTDKDKRPVYEPPTARDLSEFGASGQRPCLAGGIAHGLCSTGGSLAPAPCPAGPSPVAPDCTGGSNPSI